MKVQASEDFVELIPETNFEREQLKRISHFAEIKVDITTNSAQDSSCWPGLGPTGTVKLFVKMPA